MTTSTEILIDSIERVRRTASTAVAGLSETELETRLDPEANTIGWLAWHLARGQDAQVADAAGTPQVWTATEWSARFGLPFDDSETGYAHSADKVAQVRGVRAELFTGYIDAVCDRTVEYLHGLTDADLERIVDEGWDPPVTLAVRLVSIVSDCLQHAGQAAFIRGVVQRREQTAVESA